jgi:hypothetical protein
MDSSIAHIKTTIKYVDHNDDDSDDDSDDDIFYGTDADPL